MDLGYDARRRLLTLDRKRATLPSRCLSCGADTDRMKVIYGTPKSFFTVFAMLFFRPAVRTLALAVPVCAACVARDRWRVVGGWAVGIGLVALGGWCLTMPVEALRWTGLALMLLGPIAVTIYVILGQHGPVLHHFTNDFVQVRLRGAAVRGGAQITLEGGVQPAPEPSDTADWPSH